ncbi:MAG: HSP33-like protein chaperonin, partial [uncultured bacterium]
GNRYQGMVTWQGDSLAQSIEGYFKQSEQVPTRLWIAVNAKHAAGLFIQSMPRESARLGKTSANEHWEHISHLSATITAHELLMLDNMTLLRRLYAEEDVRLFTPKSVKFGCTCSLERGENALRLLGREEVEQELHAKQKIVVTCEFCSKEFVFDRVDVERIFKQDKPDSSHQVH